MRPPPICQHSWQREVHEVTSFSSYMPEYVQGGWYCYRCGLVVASLSDTEYTRILDRAVEELTDNRETNSIL